MASSTLSNPVLSSSSSCFSLRKSHPIQTPRARTLLKITCSNLRVAVVGGGPAGSSAAETLARSGIETFLIERNPSGSKPCGGAIPLCMLSDFSLPAHIIDRRVSKMRILSPSNIAADFSKSLLPHEHIPMLRREILDSFLRHRAQSHGAHLINALFTSLQLPASSNDPYIISYTENSKVKTIPVDVVIGADGANGRVAKFISAGTYTCAIAFQERIRLSPSKMDYYEELAEMYVGDDVSPDFYGWVFPKCDHVAVGTGTIKSKKDIRKYQSGIRQRVWPKIAGGEIIRVEAHPIPEHPRPRRVRGRVALVGDAAGYVTKCSGEGIYFAAMSGRLCGEAVVRAWEKSGRVTEEDLREGYLREWDRRFRGMFRFLDLLQGVFYGSDVGREALVELCGNEYVQRMTFDSYLYKTMAKGVWWKDLGLGVQTLGTLVRAGVLGEEMERIGD